MRLRANDLLLDGISHGADVVKAREQPQHERKHDAPICVPALDLQARTNQVTKPEEQTQMPTSVLIHTLGSTCRQARRSTQL